MVIMMKRIEKIFKIALIVAMLFINLPITKAAGTADLGFSGSSSATVGSNIEITLVVNNISGVPNGISGVNAEIVFDSNYLEFVECKSLASFNISYVESAKKIAGFAVGNNITTSSANLVKFTFKPLKKGSTKLELKGYKLTDGNSSPLNLNVGSKTITINDPVPKSSNANLSSLGVTGYTLTPTFDKNTLEYRVNVPNSVTSATITATPEDSKATVQRSLNVTNLQPDRDHRYTITVTAEDGTKKNYVVIIYREKAPEVPKSTDNTLKSLGVSGYNISPAFNKDTTEYNLTVPNDQTKVTVKAEANDTKAKVEIKGGDNLQVGNNKVEVIVTAEDGSTKVYNINVSREEKKTEEKPKLDDDATLSKLYIGGYTLNPTFNKNTNVYTINVGEAVGGLNVDATPSSSKAKVEVKGNNGWKYGMNHVTIVVTAENGNKNTYIINVNRKDPSGKTENKSNDSYLNSLVVNDATLSPSFDKDISSYNVKVPYDMEKLDISYVTSNNKAKVEILNNDELKVGNNNIQVKVTAEDGSIRIYTINATRSALSSNNNLKILSANGFQLSPGFAKDILEYNVKVNSNTDSLDLTALAESDSAKVEITGNKNFQVGNNVVLIKVTDENGFSKYYQINVNKPEAAIMGMNIGHFLMLLFLGLGLVATLLLLLLILRKRKDKNNQVPQQPVAPTPVIDFKPEFNFGSRNGTDDDVVYPGGTLNQGSQIGTVAKEPKQLVEEARYEDLTDEDYEDITRNFDYFDQTITKDELIAAIREGIETKNTDKLKMLLKQDELNQLKKEIKRKEMAKRRSDRYDDF